MEAGWLVDQYRHLFQRITEAGGVMQQNMRGRAELCKACVYGV